MMLRTNLVMHGFSDRFFFGGLPNDLFLINFWLTYFKEGVNGIRLSLVESSASTVEISLLRKSEL